MHRTLFKNKLKNNSKNISLNLNFNHHITELEEFIKNPNLTSTITGAYLSKFKGQGIEFEEYKEYISGSDDASKIDWLASTKTNSLLVKKFKARRNLNVLIVLDTSKSMFFTSTEKLKCEYATELAATLAFTIIESGDNVGIAIFNDGIKKFIPFNSTTDHYFEIIKELKNTDNYYGIKNYTKTFRKLEKLIVEKEVLLFIISDFSNLDGAQLEYLDILCGGFDICGFMIKDYREEWLPDKGLYTIKSSHSNEQLLINSKEIKEIYYKEYRKNILRLKNHFLEKDDDLIEIDMRKDFESQLIQFFIQKKERWK